MQSITQGLKSVRTHVSTQDEIYLIFPKSDQTLVETWFRHLSDQTGICTG